MNLQLITKRLKNLSQNRNEIFRIKKWDNHERRASYGKPNQMNPRDYLVTPGKNLF